MLNSHLDLKWKSAHTCTPIYRHVPPDDEFSEKIQVNNDSECRFKED